MFCATLVRSVLPLLFAAPQGFPPEDPVVYPWPPEIPPSGASSDMVSGRLTGNERDHVAILQGDLPVILFEPAAFLAIVEVELNLTVLDLAVLRFERRAVESDRDVLITVGSDGLGLLEYTSGGPLYTPLHATTEMRDAPLVRVADVNNDNLDDIAVLLSDLRTVRVFTQTAAGAFIDTGDFGVESQYDVLDFEILEVDGNFGTPEIVLDNSYGIEFFEVEGDWIWGLRSLRPELDCMTVMRDPFGFGFDRVLWCTARVANPASTKQWLVIVEPESYTIQGTTDLGIIALSAADIDADGVLDAVCSRGNGESLVYLWGQVSATKWFSFAEERSQEQILIAGGAPEAVVTPALVTDLSNDEYTDILYPIDSTGEILMFDGPIPREESGAPGPGGGSFFQGNFVSGDICFDPGFEIDDIVSFPDVTFTGLSAIYDDTDFQLESMLFTRSEGSTYLPPDPDSYCVQPFSTYPVPPGLGTSDVVEVGFTCDLTLEQSFFLYLRVVKVDSQSRVVSAGPPLLGAISVHPDTQQQISSLYQWPGWTFEDMVSCTGLGPGLRINGFTRIRRVPPFTPGTTTSEPPAAACKNVSHKNP